MKLTNEVQIILDKINSEIEGLTHMTNLCNKHGIYKDEQKLWESEINGMIWIRESILYEVFGENRKQYFLESQDSVSL